MTLQELLESSKQQKQMINAAQITTLSKQNINRKDAKALDVLYENMEAEANYYSGQLQVVDNLINIIEKDLLQENQDKEAKDKPKTTKSK